MMAEAPLHPAGTSTTPSDVRRWPVIVNQSLQDGDIMKMLTEHHKVRVAEKTITNTCIFPMSGVAFMVQGAQDLTQSTLRPDILSSLEKFLRVHRRCYLLLVADLYGPSELDGIASIQQRFLNQHLNILPTHSSAECVQSMLKIAKVSCQPGSSKLNKWISSVRGKQCNEEAAVLEALGQVGLSSHQITYLLDGLGSLSTIATADKDSLINCSLDAETADKVVSYFRKDFVAV